MGRAERGSLNKDERGRKRVCVCVKERERERERENRNGAESILNPRKKETSGRRWRRDRKRKGRA